MKIVRGKEKDIMEGNLTRVLLSLAFPLMISDLSEVLYNIADTLWLSWLGPAQVAAPTVSWPPIYVLLSFGNGVISVGYSNITKAWGKGDLEDTRKNSGALLSFSFLFSLIISLISLVFSSDILRLMGIPQDVYPYAIIYFRIMLAATPLAYITIAFSVISSSLGDAYLSMKIGLISSILNVVLDPLLIFGYLGFPAMGVAGAAIATMISRGLTAAYSLVLLFNRYEKVRLSLSHLKIPTEWMRTAIKVGFPLGIHRASNSLGQTVLVSFISIYGSSALAAYGISMRIIDLIQTYTSGLGRSTAIVIGMNLGKGNTERVWKASLSSLKLMFFTLAVLGLILGIFKENLLMFFTNDPAVISLGSSLLLYSAISLPFFGLFFSAYGVSNGSGRTYFFGLISVLRTWVFRIGAIALIIFLYNIPIEVIWVILAVSNVFAGILGTAWVIKKKWLI
ncbi:MAG: MATE family efflux transporter [Fervidicoccaceae archaeon]